MGQQKVLSVDEINQLRGSYDKLVQQNKSFQKELNFKKQELDEISSGVLMIAEVLGLYVPKNVDVCEIISEIALAIEERSQKVGKQNND